MIQVDEVYPIDINTTIGPTGTIKRLFRNRSYFRERGYEMTIFANHPIGKRIFTYKYAMKELRSLPEQNDGSIMADSINTNKWKNKVKSKLKWIVEGNKCLAAYAYNKRIGGNKVLVSQYLGFDRHPDIIVFHEVESCYHYYQLVKGKPAKTAMFIHADGSDDEMFLKTHPKLAGTSTHRVMLEHLKFAADHCDRIVFISRRAKQVFCDAHPEINPNKVVALLNGIDDMPMKSVASSCPFKYRLCCTGTVSKRKGQYIVIEAMKRMDPKVLKDTHFTIMGVGPDYSRLTSIVDEYGLGEHVNFKGNVPNKEVHDYLCAENIYILMSNNEGLPISIIEAMRAGLPIISTNIAGIPEEVDERNGFLVNPDVEELVDVLNRLPEYDIKKLGFQSRKRFENEFTFEIMRKNYADLFDKM